jgi:hypothetical protein
VVTIQTKTNNKLKLNPAVPIRIRSPHAVPCAAPASSITNFAVLPIAGCPKSPKGLYAVGPDRGMGSGSACLQ